MDQIVILRSMAHMARIVTWISTIILTNIIGISFKICFFSLLLSCWSSCWLCICLAGDLVRFVSFSILSFHLTNQMLIVIFNGETVWSLIYFQQLTPIFFSSFSLVSFQMAINCFNVPRVRPKKKRLQAKCFNHCHYFHWLYRIFHRGS